MTDNLHALASLGSAEALAQLIGNMTMKPDKLPGKRRKSQIIADLVTLSRKGWKHASSEEYERLEAELSQYEHMPRAKASTLSSGARNFY